jgi:hypothetical protein
MYDLTRPSQHSDSKIGLLICAVSTMPLVTQDSSSRARLKGRTIDARPSHLHKDTETPFGGLRPLFPNVHPDSYTTANSLNDSHVTTIHILIDTLLISIYRLYFFFLSTRSKCLDLNSHFEQAWTVASLRYINIQHYIRIRIQSILALALHATCCLTPAHKYIFFDTALHVGRIQAAHRHTPAATIPHTNGDFRPNDTTRPR